MAGPRADHGEIRMTAERWQQVKAIFHEAVECDTAARAGFLRDHCGGDEELRREVESLLDADRNSASPLDSPVVGAGAVAAAIPTGPGAVLPERYQILGELGRGGMGIVYKAFDRETREVLALKILKPEIAADLQIVERFKNELRLAHRVTHHNVARLYEFHRAGDAVYLSMEYVEGESLRSLLRRTGRLDVAACLEIARQIAAGVAEAHRQSIVHRDLKPENIMLVSGSEVKVLDFGISRYSADLMATTTGIIGTPAYMSPEQAEGRPADHRSDIYALGLILYEMFTGTAAFQGDTPVSLALKQIREQPRPPRTLAPELPPHIERAILKCLEKDPADRFQSVEDVVRGLEDGKSGATTRTRSPGMSRRRSLFAAATVLSLAAAGVVWLATRGKNAAPSQDQPSIAVLPFADMSAEKNQEYFSEGIADELRDALAKLPGLRVTGRISASQWKGKSADFGDIGKKLNVVTVLQGSVRTQGNRARISVQLIKTADGSQLWSETFEREMSDILFVQEEVARAVTGALKITLLKGQAAASSRNTNADAYKAYLQGQYFLVRRNNRNLEKAVACFEKAVQLDPNYARAWVGLAESRMYYVPAAEAYTMAREAVKRALALNPDLGVAHAAMAAIQIYRDFDWAAADASSRRALALEPGDTTVIMRAGRLAQTLGRFDEAISRYRQAVDIDPLNPESYRRLGIVQYHAGQPAEAQANFRKALELAPELANTHVLLGLAFLEQARPQEALAEIEKEVHPFWRRYGLALAYHALRRWVESDAKLDELIADYAKDAPKQIADVYAFRGEADRAFEWLQRALTDRDPGLIEIKGDPLWKALQRDRRYAVLLQTMGLPL